MNISGNIVDIVDQIIYPGTVTIQNGFITDIHRNSSIYDTYILPGFIDAHVHIESSMLTPSGFARLAVIHGTVAAVCDPHEIANVLGMAGIRFMIEDAAKSPFHFYFGAPSCVPATRYETAGARIGIKEIERLLGDPDIHFLSEVMNFPAVVNGETEVMKKIAAAHRAEKPIDGHAPGLSGDQLSRYAKTGITTDHECVDIKEALEKISIGMRISIREGSAARNFDSLASLIATHGEMCMLCSDDKHPDDLVKGHMNDLVRRAISGGIDPMSVLRCATLNPALHYNLNVGLLRKNDPADFIIIDNLHQISILRTYLRGVLAAQEGQPLLAPCSSETPNNFKAGPKAAEDFKVRHTGGKMRVIEALEGQILTGCAEELPLLRDGYVISDTSRDILKIAVVNRYKNTAPAVAFIRNFGLKKGALASSVAHDSHNIIVTGVTDRDISRCVNLIVEHGGGICVACDKFQEILPLPIGGIMSNRDGYEVAQSYVHLTDLAHSLGTHLSAPFMTLSFMALPVIPRLKITDKGLFSGDTFSFTGLFTE